MARSTIFLLFVFIIFAHTAVDARAIQQDTINELIIETPNENQDLFHYGQSDNVKALKSLFKQHNYTDQVYCKICHILVPIVYEI